VVQRSQAYSLSRSSRLRGTRSAARQWRWRNITCGRIVFRRRRRATRSRACWRLGRLVVHRAGAAALALYARRFRTGMNWAAFGATVQRWLFREATPTAGRGRCSEGRLNLSAAFVACWRMALDRAWAGYQANCVSCAHLSSDGRTRSRRLPAACRCAPYACAYRAAPPGNTLRLLLFAVLYAALFLQPLSISEYRTGGRQAGTAALGGDDAAVGVWRHAPGRRRRRPGGMVVNAAAAWRIRRGASASPACLGERRETGRLA